MIEITIPVLNEEATLNEKVNEIDRFLCDQIPSLKIKLIIADNGSTDRTAEIARKLASQIDRVEYFVLPEKGVGRALKASWKKSKATIVGYMDLDLATDLAYLPMALEQLVNNEADVVTGTRLHKDSVVVGRPPIRKITSYSLNLILKLVFSVRFTDGMCGFKFLKRTHIESLIDNGATSNGWFFATEILIVAEHLGLSIYDLPVKWTDDPNSKVKILKLSLEYLSAIRRLKRHLAEDTVKV